MARVDLFFGATPHDGLRWRRFLADVVTPRFPAGLTSLDGRGQWKSASTLVREPAHVLVIFYRRDATSDAKIDAIRAIYKARFRQSSVLRADSAACVSE